MDRGRRLEQRRTLFMDYRYTRASLITQPSAGAMDDLPRSHRSAYPFGHHTLRHSPVTPQVIYRYSLLLLHQVVDSSLHLELPLNLPVIVVSFAPG